MDMSAAQVIQAMIVPVVLVSACALLLLGMNNKYSLVIGRIRALAQERRSLILSLQVEEKDATRRRMRVVTRQLRGLRQRARLDRDSVLCYSMAAGLFLADSLLLGLQTVLHGWQGLALLSLAVFSCGVVLIGCGIIFACREAYLGYFIVMVELNEAEEMA